MNILKIIPKVIFQSNQKNGQRLEINMVRTNQTMGALTNELEISFKSMLSC